MWWCLVAKSCLTLVTPVTIARQSSFMGFFQARILECICSTLPYPPFYLQVSAFYPHTAHSTSSTTHVLIHCVQTSHPSIWMHDFLPHENFFFTHLWTMAKNHLHVSFPETWCRVLLHLIVLCHHERASMLQQVPGQLCSA